MTDVSMTDSVVQQFWVAMAALGLGMTMGVVYDAYRAVTSGKTGRWLKRLAAVLDVLFWLICLIAVLWFGMTVGRGELRIYAVVTFFAGGWLYRRWISPLVRRLLRKIFGGIYWLVRFCLSPIIAALCKMHNAWRLEQARKFTAKNKRGTRRVWRKTVIDIQRRTTHAEKGTRKKRVAVGETRHRGFFAVRRHVAHQQSGELQSSATTDSRAARAVSSPAFGQRRYQSTKRAGFRL